ncbi:MAG: CBS domain-containing protein [Bacteroidota bacterium]
MFVFFSLLLNKRVLGANNRKVGVVYDISFQLSEQFPRAISLIVSNGSLNRKYADVPWEYVEGINEVAKLTIPSEKISFNQSHGTYEFTLRRDLLDQQVVDTFNRKVIRVNDVHLLRVDRELRVAHVDIGVRGLVRRLGWEKPLDAAVRLLSPSSPYLKKEHFIGWKYIQPLAVHPVKGTVRLSVAYKDLAQIPSADLGEIMVDLGSAERVALFKSLDLKTQARILEGVSLDIQEALLEELEAKDAVRILEQLPPDMGADILEKMPVHLVQQLLGLMETTRAKKLSMLLSYSSESAGGLMTTEYISLPHTITVAEAISHIKEMTLKTETIYYAYIVDENHKLLGSVSLKDLLVAQPEQAIADVMFRKPISVHVNDTVRSVAFKLDKYNMVVIPVINEGGILQGIITIDDILSKVISIAWKRRARTPAAS